MNNYQPVIGLEVHIELSTKSKMFCACSATYFGAKPNTHTCPICLGLPGAMPKANRVAIRYAQILGLALNCQTPKTSKFDRKNYFYPDLPKGFQISQYDLPFSQKGFIEIKLGKDSKIIEITRAHLEEDTGKLTHASVRGKKVTLIDFNRSGVPLVEVVSEPRMHSSEEAKVYAQKLAQIVRYLGISDCDMEKGSMRIEPNVSLRLEGQKGLPKYKVELKNINSFKFAQKAIDFEIKRQSELLEKGDIPAQETRGWDETKNVTFSQRSKELAQDYRYFPEPDLPPFEFKENYFKSLKALMPELPDTKRGRVKKEYQLTDYDSELLTQERIVSDFFEETVKAYKGGEPKRIANWIIGELLRRLNQQGKTLDETNLLPAQLAKLLLMADKGEITTSSAKTIFEKMVSEGKTPNELIKELGAQTLGMEKLQEIVESVLKINEKAVLDFKNGKIQSIGFLIGQVQRQAQGKADPSLTLSLIKKKINPSPIEKNPPSS